ncbi:MFS transporter [Natrononativus amylolyticus]|uniref:MFS transporter n=1 Tax=Natrononativus amylolyticus TaxID=2963434 RepID=UPI0031F30795
MIFTMGTPFSYGVFIGPFSTTFQISPVVLSTIFSVMLFTFFIGAGVVSILTSQVPARLLILVCAVIIGILSPSLYFVESYVGLLVVFATMGLALGMVFVVIASIVPRWFRENRGFAIGIIFAGNGLGLFLLPPAWQLAISYRGVREGFFIIMTSTMVTFFIAGIVCRRPHWADRSTTSTNDLLRWIRRGSRTRSFRLLFVGVACTFAWYQMLAAYAIDLFTHRGLAESTASLAFGLIGGVSIISRIGSGYIADSLGARGAFLASLSCSAIGIGLFLAPQFSILILAIFLTGIGLGGSATLYIPVLLRTYGPEKDTAIVGTSNIAIGVAALAVPPIGTGIVNYTGSFEPAIVLTFVTTVLAIVTVGLGATKTHA